MSCRLKIRGRADAARFVPEDIAYEDEATDDYRWWLQQRAHRNLRALADQDGGRRSIEAAAAHLAADEASERGRNDINEARTARFQEEQFRRSISNAHRYGGGASPADNIPQLLLPGTGVNQRALSL